MISWTLLALCFGDWVLWQMWMAVCGVGDSCLWTQTALCLQQVLISSADVLSLSWALSLSARFRVQAGWWSFRWELGTPSLLSLPSQAHPSLSSVCGFTCLCPLTIQERKNQGFYRSFVFSMGLSMLPGSRPWKQLTLSRLFSFLKGHHWIICFSSFSCVVCVVLVQGFTCLL